MADKLLDDSFTEHLKGALARFAEAADADAFLNAEVGEVSARAIRGTLGNVRRLAEDAATARSRGESNAYWLGSQLDEPAREDLAATLGVDGGDAVAVGKALLERAYGSFFATDEAVAAVAAVLEAVPELQPVSNIVDAFFTSPLGDSAEHDFSAVVGGATYQYLTGRGLDVSPSAAAAAVDVALFTQKVGYQNAPGSAGSSGTVDEAAEAIGDRVAAALAAMAGQAIEAGAETAGRAVGALVDQFVSQFFKMGPIAQEVGGQVGRWAGAAIRPLVEQGVKFVTGHIVNAASKAVTAAMTWARTTVSRGLKSIFG